MVSPRSMLVVLGLIACCAPAHALTIRLAFAPGTSAQAQQAFVTAGARWSAVLTDDVTVDLTVGMQPLSVGVLRASGTRRVTVTWSSFRTALANDATSGLDAVAVATLPAGSFFGLLINRTSDNPNGAGSATPYVDAFGANNAAINLSSANARALALDPGTGTVGLCTASCDGSLVFSTSFAYDFDPSDGITPGSYDFVGLATHEMGHLLGFLSGVDILDLNSPPVGGPFMANQFTFVSPLDLFRFSSLSVAAGVIDFTADARDKYLSIDAGAHALHPLGLGVNFGDGRQASEWRFGADVGLMDPTFTTGELLRIALPDVQAFDLIGWNVVPEPDRDTLAVIGVLGLAVVAARRRPRTRGAHRAADADQSAR